MPKPRLAPLSPEARKLRGVLAAQASRHPESDPKVVDARRAYMVQRLADLAAQLQPYTISELSVVKNALELRK